MNGANWKDLDLDLAREVRSEKWNASELKDLLLKLALLDSGTRA